MTAAVTPTENLSLTIPQKNLASNLSITHEVSWAMVRRGFHRFSFSISKSPVLIRTLPCLLLDSACLLCKLSELEIYTICFTGRVVMCFAQMGNRDLCCMSHQVSRRFWANRVQATVAPLQHKSIPFKLQPNASHLCVLY